MSAALKECPHCGSPAQLDDCRTIWRVICTSAACGALVLGDRAPEPEDGDEYPAGYWEAFEKSAIDRWNARPAFAPPVATGSVDTEEFSALAARYGNSKAGKDYMALVANAAAWGAQLVADALAGQQAYATRLEQELSRQNGEITSYQQRAEKAEAELKQVNEWRAAALAENTQSGERWAKRVAELEAQLAAAKPYDLKA